MTKKDVVGLLSKNNVVETLVNKYCFSQALSKSPYIKDLAQDIYIELLMKPDDLIVSLYKSNEIEYYLRKIISNNILSTTSPFYSKYRKFEKNTESLVFDDNGEEKLQNVYNDARER